MCCQKLFIFCNFSILNLKHCLVLSKFRMISQPVTTTSRLILIHDFSLLIWTPDKAFCAKLDVNFYPIILFLSISMNLKFIFSCFHRKKANFNFKTFTTEKTTTSSKRCWEVYKNPRTRQSTKWNIFSREVLFSQSCIRFWKTQIFNLIFLTTEFNRKIFRKI